jgi:hypothetical protein
LNGNISKRIEKLKIYCSCYALPFIDECMRGTMLTANYAPHDLFKTFMEWAQGKKDRSMSVWYDLVDWVGGYPFEVARPEAIFDFYREKGFYLFKLKTSWGGCNEFVFIREQTRKG